MGLCSLVTRVNGIYQFRKRVPAELQEIIGQTEIKKSLKTSSPEEAKSLRTQVEAETMTLFDEARSKLGIKTKFVSRNFKTAGHATKISAEKTVRARNLAEQ